MDRYGSVAHILAVNGTQQSVSDDDDVLYCLLLAFSTGRLYNSQQVNILQYKQQMSFGRLQAEQENMNFVSFASCFLFIKFTIFCKFMTYKLKQKH